MTGSKSLELPEIGSPNSTADAKVRNSLVSLLSYVNALLTSENKLDVSEVKFKWYTPKSIITEQPRESTSYGFLPTEDKIESVVVNENAILLVGYQALWKSSVSAAGLAAIFIDNNQLKIAPSGGGAPVVQAATQPGGSNVNFINLGSTPNGLLAGASNSGNAFVTTGQVITPSESFYAGFAPIQLAAGTYTIGVKYKAASGSVTAKERKLWVATLG